MVMAILACIAVFFFLLACISKEHPKLIFWNKENKVKNGSLIYFVLAGLFFVVAIGNGISTNATNVSTIEPTYCSSDISNSSYVASSSNVSSETIASSSESSSSITKTKKVKLTLEPGYYSAGYDIPVGVYNLRAVSGSGNVSFYGPGSLNEIMGTDDDDLYTKTYSNLLLEFKRNLHIEGNLTLELTGDEIPDIDLFPRGNNATKTYTFKAGEYTVGKDIDEGLYDLKAISSSGNVHTKEDMINEIMGVKTGDTYDMNTENFHHLPLISGDVLEISGSLRLKVSPSK